MWERPNWFTPNEDGAGVSTREALEALRPRGLGGPALVAGDRGGGPGDPPDGGDLRRVELRQDRDRGRRARSGFLQRLCANDVDRPVGSITYTQMLNRRGGIECDFTVTRLAAERFLIVTGTAFGNHDLGWIRSASSRLERRRPG